MTCEWHVWSWVPGCVGDLEKINETTLLDFAVILQLLTVKKYSKIPYIWFTVNYCNTHCIMGISVLILQ